MLINIWNFIRCDLVDWITLIVEIVGIIFVYITKKGQEDQRGGIYNGV